MKLMHFLYLTLAVALSSCASYEQFRKITEEFEIPTAVLDADFATTWSAVIQIMNDYEIEQKNQEAGYIKTRWIDNTLEVNFADSFGGQDAVKAAKFKLMINVTKGYRSNREVTKVTIYKRQLLEQDFLQGWKEINSDGIKEKTLLYRIERLINIDKKLQKIQKAREEEQLQSF